MPYFIFKPDGSRKRILEIPPPSPSASHFVCPIIIHIIFEWHAEAREGEIMYGRETEKVGGVRTPFISKNRLKSLFLKTTA